MVKTAIYARYSSELQSDASIEDQVRICRARAEREGWEVIAVFTDFGLSGASQLRPGYQQLMSAVEAGSFDVVLAEALDRLSRDQEHVAGLYKRLSFARVSLVTLAEGEISELHVGLKGTMNALFLKDLAAKTRRGLEGRVRQGRSGGGLAYGYKVAREFDANGVHVPGGRVIDPDEAAIVLHIFEGFRVGKSPRALARELNEEGIPGPGGRPWGDTTIRGHHLRRTGILHNDLYVGRLVWNKQRYVKDPNSGKRLARLNPESEWVIQDVPELRIVPQDLWDGVQDRLGAIREKPSVVKARSSRFWEARRPRHLLTGLVFCGTCGGSLASVGRDYLACGNARNHGTCSTRKGILRGTVENLVLDALKHNLMKPELVALFIEEVRVALNASRKGKEAQTARQQRELDQVQRKLSGLIEAIAEGLRSPGIQAKLDELEAQRVRLMASLETSSLPEPVLHPNLAELYQRKVGDLHGALAQPQSRDAALEIVRSLVEKILIHPAGKGQEIELIGAIANMVALANGGPKSTKAALGGAAVRELFESSVKVVAGAGFEPAAFRL